MERSSSRGDPLLSKGSPKDPFLNKGCHSPAISCLRSCRYHLFVCLMNNVRIPQHCTITAENLDVHRYYNTSAGTYIIRSLITIPFQLCASRIIWLARTLAMLVRSSRSIKKVWISASHKSETKIMKLNFVLFCQSLVFRKSVFHVLKQTKRVGILMGTLVVLTKKEGTSNCILWAMGQLTQWHQGCCSLSQSDIWHIFETLAISC